MESTTKKTKYKASDGTSFDSEFDAKNHDIFVNGPFDSVIEKFHEIWNKNELYPTHSEPITFHDKHKVGKNITYRIARSRTGLANACFDMLYDVHIRVSGRPGDLRSKNLRQHIMNIKDKKSAYGFLTTVEIENNILERKTCFKIGYGNDNIEIIYY